MSDSSGPGRGGATESPYRVSGPEDPKAQQQAQAAGVDPEKVAKAQSTGTAADNIPYEKKVQGGQTGGSRSGTGSSS